MIRHNVPAPAYGGYAEGEKKEAGRAASFPNPSSWSEGLWFSEYQGLQPARGVLCTAFSSTKKRLTDGKPTKVRGANERSDYLASCNGNNDAMVTMVQW